MTRQGDKPTGLRRHLEGWQLGVAVVGMALLAVALALPRPAPPHGLPCPTIDHPRLAHQHTLAVERALRRRSEPLPYEVRAVGEALRRFGALSEATETARSRALEDLRATAHRALKDHGEQALGDLQVLQTELFLAALLHFEGTGRVNSELRELGGNFIEKAEQSGWLSADGRLEMSSAERRVVFRTRWTHLLGLDQVHSLAPSLQERRLYYGFLLEHPESEQGDLRQDRARRALGYLSALIKIDPDYPADYARGVLYYDAGMYRQSMQAFERHLTHQPTGPFTLRARNFWLEGARQLGQSR